METGYPLWSDPQSTKIHFVPAEKKVGNGTVVIFAGGGYEFRAHHEDIEYAEKINEFGLNAFYVDYRVFPDRFPAPQLDARRAVRFVRANAEKFGIDPDKIAVMGSSAGGHLVSSLCNYRAPLDGEGVDELDEVDYMPNAQILCYPVITLEAAFTHAGSARNLLGDRVSELAPLLSGDLTADEKTPPAFLWHTSTDELVPVKNSLRYGERLREVGVPFELHVFPTGHHGLGLARDVEGVNQWPELLKGWLERMKWME